MNTTKKLIEQLEKESGKKVVLKEEYADDHDVFRGIDTIEEFIEYAEKKYRVSFTKKNNVTYYSESLVDNAGIFQKVLEECYIILYAPKAIILNPNASRIGGYKSNWSLGLRFKFKGRSKPETIGLENQFNSRA